MKIILVDLGNFYTKVYVFHPPPDNARGEASERSYRFYGRVFFPTLFSAAEELQKDRLYYEHEGRLNAVGYDCGALRLDRILQAFEERELGPEKLFIILKKIVFDYAEHGDDLEVHVLVDCYRQAQAVQVLGNALADRKWEISAWRGYDRRRFSKEVTIHLELLPAGDALTGFLEKNISDFTTAMVVDLGYNKTKLYLVEDRQGVERFQVGECGVSYYYQKLLQLLAEEDLGDNHFLWLVKQVELGCREVEVRAERKGIGSNAGVAEAVSSSYPRHYDISLVLKDVRWDLNKEFVRWTSDMLNAYYTSRTEWPALLAITGGGADLNGDILRLSLEEKGYHFQDVRIEKQPMYTLLEGAAYLL